MTYIDLLRWPCNAAIIVAFMGGAMSGLLLAAILACVDPSDS